MRRVVALGAAAVALYVGVVAATNAFTDRDVRPLFDAGAPAPPYRWVKPPPDFAPGNVRPKLTELDIGIKPEDLPPAGASEDGQFVFNLPKGAIAPTATDTAVVIRIEPVDPDTLGPIPANNFTDGNAYKLVFTYKTTGAPAPLSAAGSVLITVPVPAISVVYSEDGRTWRPIKSQHASATAIGAELPGPGYYLALTPESIGSASGSKGIGRLVAPILLTVLLAGALLTIPILIRRK